MIRFLRNPGVREDFEAQSGRPLVCLSSVVALELFAGCRSARHTKELSAFLAPFEKADRMIVPDHRCYREAGRVLAALGPERIGPEHRAQLVNEALIALSAARSGLVVVTGNREDYSLIARHAPVRWMVPES